MESVRSLFEKARACRARGDREGAFLCLREIVSSEPSNAEALNNLGLLYYESGDVAEAERCFAQALELKPTLVEAYLGLSGIMESRGDLNAAKNLLCDALRRQPDCAVAHFRLGRIMREWDQLDLAVTCFGNALRFNPDDALALNNLAETQQAAGEIDASESNFRKVLSLDPDSNLAQSNLFISMNYNPVHTPKEIFDAHCRWGERLVSRAPEDRVFVNVVDPERKLRLGYLSADFCNHPAASFLEPIFEHHDREWFSIICYSQGKICDEKTQTFRRLADDWREINGLTDDDAAELIRRDAIDILIDCTGHMSDNRLPLFARKNAPIQVSWIGYPNTTGLPSVDYRFADNHTDPPGERPLFSEKLVRLENGFCCFAPPHNAPPVAPLPAKEKDAITFGSLHNVARLNDEVIRLWSMVLKTVPSSRLLIFRTTLNAGIIGRLSQIFAAQGIDVARIDFAKTLPPGGHLAVYDKIDIALDTFPWSGHTTACHALWMGVPVLTLKGNRHAGRMVASVLAYAGMSEFGAASPEEYVGLATRLASDLPGLAALRAGLRERVRTSKLCDGATFTHVVEREYRAMWRSWCEATD